MPETTDRFVVRRRADGWAVWDRTERRVVDHQDTEALAQRACERIAVEESVPRRTYGLTWYVEVDATDEADAVRKARRFLHRDYRDGWEPSSMAVYDAEQDAMLPIPTSKETPCPARP